MHRSFMYVIHKSFEAEPTKCTIVLEYLINLNKRFIFKEVSIFHNNL